MVIRSLIEAGYTLMGEIGSSASVARGVIMPTVQLVTRTQNGNLRLQNTDMMGVACVSLYSQQVVKKLALWTRTRNSSDKDNTQQ